MTLKEKIEHEQPNQIHLHLEGIFWKLYNQSAFHFSQLIKPYLVKKKYIKELKTEIVSIGFPQNILEDIIVRLKDISTSVEVGEREIIALLPESQVGYEEWFDQFQLSEKNEMPQTTNSPLYSDENKEILQALRDFPIMKKTPLEVQLFVLQLQDKLKMTSNKN